MRKLLAIVISCALFLGCTQGVAAKASSPVMVLGKDLSISRMTFVYGDRPALVKECKASWGLAVLLEFDGRKIMFNAGGDPALMRNNMEALNIDPKDLDAVVISHHHWEMVDGISYLLQENPNLPVYATDVIVEKLGVQAWEKNFKKVPGTMYLTPNVFLMNLHSPRFEGGPFGIDEVHIVIKTKEGLVVLQGCGHPRIVNIMKKSIEAASEPRVYMIAGGTRLLRPGTAVRHPSGQLFTVPQMTYYGDVDYRRIADELLNAGVKKIIPTHCTGPEAEVIFEEKFGKNYINQTLGMKIDIPAPTGP